MPATDPSNIAWDYECDILVCGCGAGGGGAVAEACIEGADVVVMEKCDWLGGSLRRSGGGISAPDTCVQRALGVQDNPEEWVEYVKRCAGELPLDMDLVELFAERGGKDFDWYVQDISGQTEQDWHFVASAPEDGMTNSMESGLNISETDDHYAEVGMTPIPRCYWFDPYEPDVEENGEARWYCPAGLVGHPDRDNNGGGTGLWKPMEDFILSCDPRILYKTALREIVASPEGEVIGAVGTSTENGTEVYVKARKGVIIATGQWARNEAMLQNYCLKGVTPAIRPLNDTAEYGTDLYVNYGDDFYAHPDHSDGAGIVAAMAIGAGTINMGAGPDMGGLKVDTNAQVLDIFGNPIPRLFASSLAVGGRWGGLYPHCGLANMMNISLGRVAAESAVALEPWE